MIANKNLKESIKNAMKIAKKKQILNFKLDVDKGSGFLPNHPLYFSGKFILTIENNKGVVEIEKNGYTLNETAIAELKNFVFKNTKKLEALLKNKKEPENLYEGEPDGSPSSSIILTIGNEKFEIDRLEIAGDINKKNYDKIMCKIQKLVSKAIKKKNAYIDENSPNPVKEAEEWDRKRKEKQEKLINAIAEERKNT